MSNNPPNLLFNGDPVSYLCTLLKGCSLEPSSNHGSSSRSEGTSNRQRIPVYGEEYHQHGSAAPFDVSNGGDHSAPAVVVTDGNSSSVVSGKGSSLHRQSEKEKPHSAALQPVIYQCHSDNSHGIGDDDDVFSPVISRSNPESLSSKKEGKQEPSLIEEEEEEEGQSVYEDVSESCLYVRGPAGFQNKIGENNCFLNVVLQSLFLLPPFATKFAGMELAHRDTPVYNALKSVFVDYQFHERDVISPEEMRITLDKLYGPKSQFKLNKYADACEAFEAILDELHKEISHTHSGDDSCQPRCLVHSVFGIGTMSQKECPNCHATSEVLLSNSWTIPITVLALITKFRECGSFEHSVKETLDDLEYSCPASHPCPGCPAKNVFFLMEQPPIMSFSFSWPSSSVDSETVVDFVKTVPLTIDVREIFPNASSARSVLRGIVCFFGCHYVLLFMSRCKEEPDVSKKVWFLFDDTRVRKVGVWDNAKECLVRCKYRPTLMFYGIMRHVMRYG